MSEVIVLIMDGRVLPSVGWLLHGWSAFPEQSVALLGQQVL